MHRGRIVEQGDAEQVYADPQHEYTQALLAAVPGPTRRTSANGGRSDAHCGRTSGMHEERFHAETREQWRAWLAEHAAEGRGVWLVTWKKASGRPLLTYEDAVTEALAFGWVDSKGGKLDADRTMLWFTARKGAAAGPGRTSAASRRSRRRA